MTRLAIIAVVALALSATTAFASQPVDEPIVVGIDTDSTGNDATTVGDPQTCREVAEGDVFTVDIYSPGIPAPTDTLGGIIGFSYNLHFDPDVLEVQTVDDNLLLQAGGHTTAFEQIDADATNEANNDLLPGTTGNLRVDYLDFGETFESGPGVLSRIGLKAVGSGRSSLDLTDDIYGTDAPTVISTGALPTRGGAGVYPLTQLLNAVIAVGEPCGPTPTPYVPQDQFVGNVDLPSASPADGSPGASSDGSTTPTGTPAGTAPAGDAQLAVDAIPTGNSADSIDDIQDCASAKVGDVFSVDVVIEDIQDLIAWETSISYDPEVLRVTDRQVKLFLEASGGSTLDASAQTPDSTGAYSASAVDTADPLSPESGSGVLVRLTMEALVEGASPVSLAPVDINNDDKPDRGVLLRNADGEIIGDETGDSLFDGPLTDAVIRVGTECPDPNARVVQLESASPTAEPQEDGDDDGSSSLPWIIGAVVAVLLLAGAAGAVLYRRSRPPAPPAA